MQEYSDAASSSSQYEIEFQELKQSNPRLKTASSRVGYLINQIFKFLFAIVVTIIPSFTPIWGSSARDTKPKKRISETAYLDGLRGVASFIVFLYHLHVNWFPAMRHSYGETKTDYYFFQLPVVRIFLNGTAAVAIFFVISGYALSYHALKLIHGNQKPQVLDSLSSSVFRRCFRIYLPCTVDTFISMLLAYNNLYTKDPLGWNPVPPVHGQFITQVKDWWNNQLVLMYPFRNVEGAPYGPPYNGHLWTIPLEIRGSFVVYGTVLGVAKLSDKWRMAMLLSFTSYLWFSGKWDLFLFTGGVCLANIDNGRRARQRDLESTIPESEIVLMDESRLMEMEIADPPYTRYITHRLVTFYRTNAPQFGKVLNPFTKVFQTTFPAVLFLVSIYMMCVPEIPWAIGYLTSITPSRWGSVGKAWQCAGSILCCLSLSLSPPRSAAASQTPTQDKNLFSNFNLQAIFTSRVAQYLGRISFGLYVMHGLVLFTIGTKLLVTAWNEFEETEDNGQYVNRWFVATCINTPVAIWAADVFARAVDERSVRWAKIICSWMERKS